MKKFVFAAACVAVLASCAKRGAEAPPDVPAAAPPPSSEATPPSDPNWPCTVEGVAIPRGPERVVSLNPSITEVMCDMGFSGKLAGVSGYCAYPPEETAALPRCGTELRPDAAAIAGAEADWVFTLNSIPAPQAEALLDAGVQLLTLAKPDDFERLPGYYDSIARALLGEREGAAAAQAFAAPLASAYQAIASAANGLAARPVGVFAALLPLALATGDSPQGKLLAVCGVDNMAGAYTLWQYPPDMLLALNPDVLVADTRTAPLDAVRAHPNYQTTACVKNDRLLGVDGAAIENGGRRFYQTMLDIARLAGADLPGSLGALEAGRGGESA